MRSIYRICCLLITLLFLFGISGSFAEAVHEDNDASCNAVLAKATDSSCPTVELPPEFAMQYPGYTGIGKLDTWMKSEEDAAYLAKNKDGWLVLLCGVNHENTGWTFVESTPLPTDSSVVMEGDIWMLDLGHIRCSVCRYHDDIWGIYMIGWYDYFIGPKWIGSRELLERQYYGKHPWGDLTTMDWISLESSLMDALQYLDVSGYATPNQDDVNSMTAIYKTPDKDSTFIISLMNGAPLSVVERNDEWTHVCMGRDDGTAWKIDGWVQTNRLVFSEEVNHDRFGMPDSILRAKRDSLITLYTPVGSETITGQYYDSMKFFVIGEGMADGMDCWVVYSAYTEEIGLVEKDALVDIA